MYTRIGLLEHVGYGNLGDDATVAAVMHSIKNRRPEASIVGITLNPYDTQKRHGITSYAIRRECKLPPPPPTDENSRTTPGLKLKAVLRKHPILHWVARVVKAVTIRAPRAVVQEFLFLIESFRITKSLDVLIVSGGGQLRDSAAGPYKFPSTLFKWVILAKLTGAQCYFINVGAGPLKTWTGRFFLRHALPLADYTSFRDEKSRLLIRQIGFTGTSRVHADCVYGLPLPERTIARRSPGSRESVVGISPMRVHWDQNPRTYSHIIQQLGHFGAWLARAQHDLQLFSTELSCDSQPIADLQMAIRSECPSSRITCPNIDGIDALLLRMSSMDYVVTCRFHGVVFAHLLNIPVLAISHHPKVAALMKDIGLSDYCLDIDLFNVDQLIRTFNQLVANAPAIKDIMAERAAQYRGELDRQFASLFPEGPDRPAAMRSNSPQYSSESR
jgi:polysaccharide pyruvyl transferase WcaK-like protein